MIKFNLKVQLAMNDMNQKQLCELADIRPTTLSKINRGTIQLLPIDVLDKICRELHCGVGDLIEYVEDEK